MENSSYSKMVEVSAVMANANDTVELYNGKYLLKTDVFTLEVEGSICFEWFPNIGVYFSCSSSDVFKYDDFENLKVEVDGCEMGRGHVTRLVGTYSNSKPNSIIRGLIADAILGDKSIPVNKIRFSIPNLRELQGSKERIISSKGTVTIGRFILENDHSVIYLDKSQDYNNRSTELSQKGGYLTLYNGELTVKKGNFVVSDIKDTIQSLSTFLTFINGRKTGALFIEGVHQDETVWKNFNVQNVDSYKYSRSWIAKGSIPGLNDIWQCFSQLWNNENDRNFLKSVVHWYVIANTNVTYVNGSIMIAQTALELIYNWWIIEKKGMILGRDSENISASNKIRLLLSQLNINHNVPNRLHHLQQFVSGNSDISDAPEAVTQIRNAIVHSQENKRKYLESISHDVKIEALEMSLWYIELSLLAIMGFEEQYCNRCFHGIWEGQGDEYTPWSKKRK